MNDQSLVRKVLERSVSILAYIFPFVEISSTLALKVFLSADSQFLRYVYFTFVTPVTDFYRGNAYLCFAGMLAMFTVCATGKVPFTNRKRKIPFTNYVRFNVVQAVLIQVVASCFSVLYADIPMAVQESTIGLVLATGSYFYILSLISSSIIVIMFGRWPTIPVISEAAKMQIQRF
jgi:hypothetical protein